MDHRAGDASVNIPLNPVTKQSLYDADPSGNNTPSRAKGSPRHHHHHSQAFGHRVRRDPNASKKMGYDGEEDTINRMGRFYKRILNFSIITRYLLYVSPIALCIAVPIIVGATAAQDARIGGVRIVWFFTWVEILWLSLWVSKIVVHFLPPIFQILAGVVSSGTRKYALILRSLEIPLSLVGWSVTSLATFVPLMTQNPDNRARGETGIQSWETIVQAILGAFVASSLVFLVEKTFVQLISINYHRKQFNARIKDNKRNVYILGLLYEASRALFPMYCTEFAEEDYTIADSLDLRKVMGNSKGHSRSGSATPMKLLQDVGRIGDKVTSAFGNVAKEVTGKQVFNPNSAHSIVVEALEKKRTSEALARRLWMSFVVEGNESLLEEDIIEVLGREHGEEAAEAFTALDRDGNGDISLDEMVLTVTEIGRERKSIAVSMHDVDQAITVLDRLLLTVVFIAVIFIFIAFLNRNFVTTLATAGTALLSLSFVFAVTAQEVLGSCIFLFVKHPFDIGDRVDINKDQLIVDHISLLFTVFRRVTGDNVGRLVQIPNIVLNGLWIENISRSKAMKEQISLQVNYDTTFEDVQLLKTELLSFVRAKENARDFQPDLEVEVLGTSDLSKMELRVEIYHRSNWANETVRAARRSKFMCALIAALRRVPIYAPGGGADPLGSAANASYSVAIPADIAASNKDAAAKTRDASRLVPRNSSSSPDEAEKRDGAADETPLGLTRSQNSAINKLNARDPGQDAARDDVYSDSRDDSLTLNGERPSIDRRDEDNIKGILRRESTKGRRKAGAGAVVDRLGYSRSSTLQPNSSQEYGRDRSASNASSTGNYLQQQNSNASRPPLSTINSLRSLNRGDSPPRQQRGSNDGGESLLSRPTYGPGQRMPGQVEAQQGLMYRPQQQSQQQPGSDRFRKGPFEEV